MEKKFQKVLAGGKFFSLVAAAKRKADKNGAEYVSTPLLALVSVWETDRNLHITRGINSKYAAGGYIGQY